MTNLTHLRDNILKKRGLKSTRDSVVRQKKLQPDRAPSTVHKTPLMLYLEMKFGADIVDLVSEGSVRQVAEKMYPFVDYSTVSKWRKQFGKEITVG